MSKAKKVIFVIVEGPTDKDALSSVLKQIFSSAEVHFHVIYGDITTEDAITANNAKSYVAKRVAAEMKKYAYKESDILQIVHSFNEKVETIRKAKAEMNRQRDCLNNLDVEHLPWIEDFKSYQNLTSLNRRVLVELVESITVYDKEHIHIQYRFDQEIRNVLEYCSSIPAAETEESAV